MDLQLTEQERQFLLSLLDQVTVRGIESKAMVLQLMAKLSGRAVVPEAGGAILSAAERPTPGNRDGREAA